MAAKKWCHRRSQANKTHTQKTPQKEKTRSKTKKWASRNKQMIRHYCFTATTTTKTLDFERTPPSSVNPVFWHERRADRFLFSWDDHAEESRFPPPVSKEKNAASKGSNSPIAPRGHVMANPHCPIPLFVHVCHTSAMPRRVGANVRRFKAGVQQFLSQVQGYVLEQVGLGALRER